MEARNVASILFALSIGTIVGYFAGREYLKYEMRTTLQSAVTEFQQNLKNAFGNPPDAPRRADTPAPRPKEPAPMSVELIEKGFHESNPRARDYDEAVTFAVSFSNRSNKATRAFDGILTFRDLLDNEILGAKVAINEPVAANSSLRWDGQIDYNRFMASHRRLRDEDRSNLKVRFNVRKILFSDGTMKNYSE